jgi:hypothetical protein
LHDCPNVLRRPLFKQSVPIFSSLTRISLLAGPGNSTPRCANYGPNTPRLTDRRVPFPHPVKPFAARRDHRLPSSRANGSNRPNSAGSQTRQQGLLRGNSEHSRISQLTSARRRFRTLAPSPRNGKVRPLRAIRATPPDGRVDEEADLRTELLHVRAAHLGAPAQSRRGICQSSRCCVLTHPSAAIAGSVSLSSSVLASLRSVVSKPSVNQPRTGRACVTLQSGLVDPRLPCWPASHR